MVAVTGTNKKNLLSFDAFSKTVDDAKIKTATGGLITIGTIIIILWLSLLEYLDFRKIDIKPQLVVDKARGMDT